jgi:hypothetical protein
MALIPARGDEERGLRAGNLLWGAAARTGLRPWARRWALSYRRDWGREVKDGFGRFTGGQLRSGWLC